MKMKTIKNKLSIGVLLILFGCGPKETAPETHHEEPNQVEFTTAQFKTAGIVLGKIEMKNLSSVIQANGMLDVPPQNLITISAIMGGFVKSIDLLQGSRVKKGQLIATIQNPDFIQIQQDFLENKSKLKFAEIEYKRQEELSKENVASKKTFEQATSEYNSLKAINSGLLEKLSMLGIDPATVEKGTILSTMSIYSPTNGYVTVMNVNIGKYVNPQDVICEIVNTEHMHAELTVFEKDLNKIKVGQKVRFVLVNEGDKERTAKIFLINKKIDADRTVRVHAHMDEKDPELIPNTYLKAFIEVTENQTTALPDESIVSAEEKYFIFIKTKEAEDPGEKTEAGEKHEEEYAFKSVEIKKGVSQNGYTEVILPEGFDTAHAEVVIKGAYDLLSKMNNSEEEGHDH
jgi:membrane fusion protein, heavy metal efflux system